MSKERKESEKMVDIKRYDKSNLPWTAKQLAKSIDNGVARFDNAVQRTLVWTKEQKSLLIHSMIIGAPIPPMYATKRSKKDEKGKTVTEYDFMDGKQRSAAIHDFLRGEYKLVDVPVIVDTDGNERDINGLEFDELDEDMRDYIESYSLLIYIFDNLDQEDIAEIFFRLNSGTALKAIDSNLAKMPSLPYVVKIAEHPIFDAALSKRAKELKADKDIIIKSLIMLKQDNPALDAKQIRTFTRTVELSDDDVSELKEIYDIILKASNQITEADVQKMTVKNSIIARRILGRGHIVSLVPFIKEHKDEDILYIRDFLWYFFSGEEKASVATDYNDASTQGSGHRENVEKRQQVLEREWKRFKK